jgi:hypothetical protein
MCLFYYRLKFEERFFEMNRRRAIKASLMGLTGMTLGTLFGGTVTKVMGDKIL